ncbi:MAG: DUF1330 domain-containing protein [Cyclobacteriaceae bacterium]
MKVFITQLIYVIPGKEDVFDQFEAIAIPIISKYNGRLLFRIRPSVETIIETSIEPPYEIHLVEFDSAQDFEEFKLDEERKQFLHLKKQSIKEAFLIEGTKI